MKNNQTKKYDITHSTQIADRQKNKREDISLIHLRLITQPLGKVFAIEGEDRRYISRLSP